VIPVRWIIEPGDSAENLALPDWLLPNKKLSTRDIFVYAVILRHQLQTGCCRVSDRTLADELGISVRTLRRSCAKLTKEATISQLQHPGQPTERCCLVTEDYLAWHQKQPDWPDCCRAYM
jgi:hypothetical protein